jgi:hypothetical protein
MTGWWPTLTQALEHLRTREDLSEPVEETAVLEASTAVPEPLPWTLRAVLVAGGFVAASTVGCGCVPFVACAQEPAIVLAPALLVLVVGTALRWLRPDQVGTWLDPALFAVVVGAELVVPFGLWAVLEMGPIDPAYMPNAVAASTGGVLLLMLLGYPDPWHRTVATVATLGCLAGALTLPGLFPIRDAVTGLAFAIGLIALALRPVLAATPLRPMLGPVGLGASLYALGGMARFWRGWDDETWILAVGGLSGLLALAVTAWTLGRLRAPTQAWLGGLFATVLVVGLGVFVPGLSVALAFLLLGLASRELTVAGAAVLAIVAYGILAWVDLPFGVLPKAFALVATGGVLLALRLWLRVAMPDAPDGAPGPDEDRVSDPKKEPPAVSADGVPA